MGLPSIFFRSRFADVSLTEVKVQTGHIPTSTPEATPLDLMRYGRRIGGLDRVFTVLQELAEVIEAGNLKEAAKSDGKIAYAQRLGFLLDKAGFSHLTENLSQSVNEKKPLPAKLDPSMPTRGCKKDERWSILVNIGKIQFQTI